MQDFNIVTFRKTENKNCEECKVTPNTALDNLPLTMVWVPMQEYKSLYECDTALVRGTLFQQLDKPFLRGRF